MVTLTIFAFLELPSVLPSAGLTVHANMCICTSGLYCAQRNGRATGENPESWVNGSTKGEHKRVEGIRLVCHTIKRSSALVTIQQHTHALWIGIDKNGFAAIMPSRQLDVKPLYTPRLVIAAQTTGGTLAVKASVR